MQAQPFQLQRQVLGALPIFDPVIERIGLLPCLTQALGQARYAEAILLLLKNILVERQALYAIRQWTAPYDPALVYGGKKRGDVFARALDRPFESHRARLFSRVVRAAGRAHAGGLSQIHQE